jgi:hypothetical protein
MPSKDEIAAPFALYTMRCPEPYRFRAVQGFRLAMTVRIIFSLVLNHKGQTLWQKTKGIWLVKIGY